MLYHSQEVPAYLSRDCIGDVDFHMVQSMAESLPSASTSDIPIEAGIPWDMEPSYWQRFDTSFARQIKEIEENSKPEAYLLTANSAIPVADSLRGYFLELGRDMPPLFDIRSNGTLSKYYYFAGEGYDASPHYEKETQRLCKLVAGLRNVCVIDQYVFSGRTISLAAQMLKDVGVSRVAGIRGTWYNDTRRPDIDLKRLRFKDPYVRLHMKAIGQKACQRAFA